MVKTLNLSTKDIKLLKVMRHALQLTIKDDKATNANNKCVSCETDDHSNTVYGTEDFSTKYSDVSKYLHEHSYYTSIDEMFADTDFDLYLHVNVHYNYNNTQIADGNQDDVIWDATLSHQDLLDRVNKLLAKVAYRR